ncbi:MAG TPA: PfkB family carbohydrate kinase [Kofleriaceae bacterium]|nr:PfkB family carbohydrate kinase [Kofleriaceae bacterium]
MRIAVVGHVEHITLGRVASLPAAGAIVHMQEPRFLAGGGGGLTFYQLVRSTAEVHLFTALGDDQAGAEVEARLRATPAVLHIARRREAHTRNLVLITPDGERTIIVIGEPQHPRRDDPLPWDVLATCDAVYFTAEDPQAIVAARAARLLVITARRRPSLVDSGVRADVVIGSAADPREVSSLADYPVAPAALVLTEGKRGGTVATARGVERFAAPASAPAGGSVYGAGDSFAGALVFYMAAGLPVAEACARAGVHGAAALASIDPLESQLPLVDLAR